MTAAMYTLFPDGREAEALVTEINQILRDRAFESEDYHGPFRPTSYTTPLVAWSSHGEGLEPEEMLRILRSRSWSWPALLVYRTSEDNRWSYLHLGLGFAEESEE